MTSHDSNSILFGWPVTKCLAFGCLKGYLIIEDDLLIFYPTVLEKKTAGLQPYEDESARSVLARQWFYFRVDVH
ncbi:hypothetical protein PZA11_001098 [Diplocarpon coronariae]